MIRILFPIGSFFPAQSGGPDNSLRWIVNEIVKDKDFIIKVATTLYSINNEMQKDYGIVPNQPRVFSENYSVTYFKLNKKNTFSPALMKWLRKEVSNFDLVFITSFFNHHSIVTSIICKIKKIPFIISPRGELRVNAFNYANKSKILKFIYIAITKPIYKHAIFHVTSQEEQIDTKKFYSKNNIILIPNLMPLNSDISVNTNRKNILYLGRLNSIKGIENLIMAYSLLPKEIKNAHKLIIAGSARDDYNKSLVKLCSSLHITNFVDFVGHVEGKAKEDLYLSSKMFVLPSYSENFAIVVVEAINYGLYVITSTNTPWKSLSDLKIGSWIENDHNSIKDEIQKVISYSDDEYQTITGKAREYIFKDFEITKNIHLYKNLITSSLLE